MIFDLFKKSVVRTSADLDDFIRTSGSSVAGVHVTSKNALAFAPVFACIKVLAEDIGQLPFNLFQTVGDSREKAIGHSLFTVLHHAPNAYQTSQEWREMLVAHLMLRGNHYSYISRVRGEVRELLPMNPDAVFPYLENYEIRYKVKFADGSERDLGGSEVFHVKLFSEDGVTGLSPITQARNAIGLGIASERYGSLLFKNGSRPGGILSTDQKLDSDQISNLREQWDATQGGDNAHRAAILSGGLQWTTVSMTPEDAQFIETRKFERSEIAGIFRVAPYKIGDLERATFSNIEHQGLSHVTDTLMPIITKIENRVNVSLIPRADRNTLFSKMNVSALLRGDMKARADFYSKQLQNGAMSPNEIRALEDMNPREGGDIYLTPLNMAINGQVPEAEPNATE